MAKNEVLVYELSEAGKKMRLHAVAVAGETHKIDKNGIVRVPSPGVPDPGAHHLIFRAYEGPGHANYVSIELAEAHKAVTAAEDDLKLKTQNLADQKTAATKAQGPEAKAEAKTAVETAETEVETAKNALKEAKKKVGE